MGHGLGTIISHAHNSGQFRKEQVIRRLILSVSGTQPYRRARMPAHSVGLGGMWFVLAMMSRAPMYRSMSYTNVGSFIDSLFNTF